VGVHPEDDEDAGVIGLECGAAFDDRGEEALPRQRFEAGRMGEIAEVSPDPKISRRKNESVERRPVGELSQL
jgi:hypothetical protein